MFHVTQGALGHEFLRNYVGGFGIRVFFGMTHETLGHKLLRNDVGGFGTRVTSE